MRKQLLGVLLAMLVLMSSLSIGAVTVSAAAEDTVTITVASVTGKKGETVEVPVSISANSSLVNADMILSFDPTQLELNTAYYADPEGDEGDTCAYQVSTSLFDNGWMYMGGEKTSGNFVFVAATGKNTGLVDGGEMFRVAFTVLTDEVDSINITFTADPICGNDGSGEADADGKPADYAITYEAVNGVVTVEKDVALKGDVNGDGAVNMYDVVALYSVVSGSTNDEAIKLRSDIDGNGSINMYDLTALYAIVSGTA